MLSEIKPDFEVVKEGRILNLQRWWKFPLITTRLILGNSGRFQNGFSGWKSKGKAIDDLSD
jgi:hypothetical protein